MTAGPLPVVAIEEAGRSRRRGSLSPEVARQAAEIVESVRAGGEAELRRLSEGFGDIEPGANLVLGRPELETAFEGLDPTHRVALERVAGRIRRFAIAQRQTLTELEVSVDGGRAGHTLQAVRDVGAYAPGGRYPLPSSVLMTVIPARVAGVERVWVASPRPTAVTLAAAAIAGADGLIAVGGAQAIAALAFGTLTPPVDLVVGPGNSWVTAAKKHLYGEIGIDGLAGPSEIAVIADDGADPSLVAADLLAQAEHDPQALPMLLVTSARVLDEVQDELRAQLADLPTSGVASAALGRGFAVVVDTIERAAKLCDEIGPEHVALHVYATDRLASAMSSYGSLFIGARSAEALADYGIGPNHVLPTGGGARFQSGLSVFTFLRSPTWIRVDDPRVTAADAALLGRLEGLEAHARAAELRLE